MGCSFSAWNLALTSESTVCLGVDMDWNTLGTRELGSGSIPDPEGVVDGSGSLSLREYLFVSSVTLRAAKTVG